jgi:hypothetical protein
MLKIPALLIKIVFVGDKKIIKFVTEKMILEGEKMKFNFLEKMKFNFCWVFFAEVFSS